MEPAFWNKRWEDNQIGFHQPQVNTYLHNHWPSLGLAPGSRVLVPLCGKSLDMLWLAAQGYRVLGVEISEKAVLDFFHEQGLEADVLEQDGFTRWRTAEIELWQGDFFDLRAEDVADCVAVYDRAALIALPPDMRERYVHHLSQVLPTASDILLVTLDYDQAHLDGPPFAVTDEEVQRLFGGWRVGQVQACDVLADSPKFVQAGVPALYERVYRIQR
ncbi:MAG TPA: thiopurine S-methyltransferase [Pseudomonas sp.]|uniref:thiopurine S-methyltransferase n=1 Tax=Pseudomonas sp. TaxID=306 RepID=UPI002B46B30C|nr:thiopurine S-methyltransferase [Pseudomonas sp.]HKS11466.1 thiopurine S-methyltransferase [Pseudomonas sp.]